MINENTSFSRRGQAYAFRSGAVCLRSRTYTYALTFASGTHAKGVTVLPRPGSSTTGVYLLQQCSSGGDGKSTQTYANPVLELPAPNNFLSLPQFLKNTHTHTHLALELLGGVFFRVLQKPVVDVKTEAVLKVAGQTQNHVSRTAPNLNRATPAAIKNKIKRPTLCHVTGAS